MSDRELLELAAKAAGIEVVGLASKYICQGVSDFALLVRNEQGGDSIFDPLTDDGDRYRLARTCKMRIDFQEGLVFAGYEIAFRFTPGNDKEEVYAIVRAAAEIGRNMK